MNSATRKKFEKRCAQFETGADELDDIHEEMNRLVDRLEKIKRKCSLRYYPSLLKAWKDAIKKAGSAEGAVFILQSDIKDKADDIEEKLLVVND
jgi:hypothetical protein